MQRIILFIVLLLMAGCRSDFMNFRFVTSGQAVDDAQVVNRVIQGLVVKPPSPSDAKIFRDAQSNALIQWRRRGRINYHWRDRAGVPISEESEYYEIEVYSGSTVVRTVRIHADEAQAVQWEITAQTNGSSALVQATDGSGTVYIPSTLFTTDFFALESQQRASEDFVYEFETYVDTNFIYLMGDLVIYSAGNNVAFATSSGSYPATAIIGNAFLHTGAVAGDHFVVQHIKGQTTYYKNPTSSGSPALLTEVAPDVSSPYRVRIFLQGGGAGIRNPSLLRFSDPDWTYTAAMQTADGLTPGNAIHLKIYQVSAITGRGLPLDVTL